MVICECRQLEYKLATVTILMNGSNHLWLIDQYQDEDNKMDLTNDSPR